MNIRSNLLLPLAALLVILQCTAFADNPDASINAQNYHFFGVRLETREPDLLSVYPNAKKNAPEVIGSNTYVVYMVRKTEGELGGADYVNFYFINGLLYEVQVNYENAPVAELLPRLVEKFGQPRIVKDPTTDTLRHSWSFTKIPQPTSIFLERIPVLKSTTITVQRDVFAALKDADEKKKKVPSPGF